MQTNNQDASNASGGLNFVFESGSAGRENKKYVRSHAAKVGWSQRSKNKEARRSSVQKDETSSRKRQKTDKEPSASQASRQEVLPAISSKSSAVDGLQREPIGWHPQSTTQASVQPYHHYQHPKASSPPETVPSVTSSYLPSPQLSWSASQQYPARQAATIRPVDADAFRNAARREDHAFQTYRLQDRSNMPVNGGHPAFPTASLQQTPAFGLHAPQMENNHCYTTRQSFATPIASSALPRPIYYPPARAQPSGSSQPTMAPPLTWRQSDNVYNDTLRSRESFNGAHALHKEAPPGPTEQSRPCAVDVETDLADKTTDAPEHGLMTPPPTRSHSPRFLDVVMNPDVPLWRSVDSGSDSFRVSPVKWQPFFGRLLENYRSNMLVQLDEIMTGWSLHEKVEFNQMPLRLAMGEPALFHALLATAALMIPPGRISPRIPQWLQSRTVDCLNSALSDARRASSDAIILTINLIALCDSIGGQGRAAATMHQPALRKLVDMRGGLKALSSSGTRDALNFVRFLAWTDRVIWCQTGNKLVFGEFEEDASISGTNWEDIWSRMQRQVENNGSAPVEEMQVDE